MKIQVERSALSDAVGWAIRAVPARPTMPVLAGMLLAAGPEGLAVSGFDFESAARMLAPATVTTAGDAVVPGRLLAEIVRSLPAGPVDLSADGSRLLLRCGGARFELPTLPREDYPVLPDLPEPSGCLTAASFAAAVAQVAVAASREEALPQLTAILIEVDGETLTLAATDRYRLAVRELRWRPQVDPASIPPATLVRARTLSETARALSGEDAEVTLALGGAGSPLVGVAGGGRTTTTRVLDGSFPAYRSLLPTSFEASAEICVAECVEAIRRVSLVLPRTQPVRLSFTAEEVTLDGAGPDGSRAQESLPVAYTGAPVTIAFNPAYLLDGLGALEGDTARLSITSSARPAVLTGKDTTYRYLLMPVRLPEDLDVG